MTAAVAAPAGAMRFPHRIQRLRELIARAPEPPSEGAEAPPPIDALIVSHLENARYLTGFSGSNAVVIVTGEEAIFLTDSRYDLQSATEAPGWERIVLPPGTLIQEAVADILKRLKGDIRRVGFEADHLTVSAYEGFRKALEGSALQLVPRPGLVEAVRQIKDASELAAIRRSIDIADACRDHIRQVARIGISELALAWEMERFMRESGASRLAFDSIVGSGPNSALIHGHPGERVLGSSGAPELLLCDWGCVVEGYCSDITRTFVIGGEPNARQREVYDLVLRVQLACIDAIRPGVLGKDVDALARTLFEEAGCGDEFAHSLGHSFGRFIHESPQLGRRGETRLEAGMVLTVEPGVYFEGFGGVRIEDDVLVTETGCEILTHSPKELITL